jgi:hypothetical protein
MRQVLSKSIAAGMFAAALALATAVAGAAETPVTFQLNWMAGGR